VCAECSQKVARWSRLEAILRRPGQSSHPPEAALLAFETDPGSLPAEERHLVRLHLDSCVPCRDALAAAHSFDFEAAVEFSAAASAASETVDKSWLLRVLGPLWEPLGSRPRPRLSPALVAAGAVLVAIPLGLAIWSGVGSETSEAPPGSAPAGGLLASEKPPLEVPAPDRPMQPEPAPAPLAALQRTILGVPPSQDQPTPGPETPVARAPAVEASERPAPEPAGEPEAPVGMVVASLIPESPLVYTPLRGSAGAGLGRFAQGRRSVGSAPAPLALAPEHVGLTVQGSTTLYWFMPARADHRVEFVLVAPDAIDPVLLLTTKAPVERGFYAVSLGEHGVTLEPGVTYRWSVALVLDEDQRYEDVISGAAIARIHPSPTLQAELEKAEPGAAGHAYAANGLWYDAMHFVSHRILERTGEASARSRRAELLEQAGLQATAEYDRQAIGAD
jgi:hypothetical protein